MGQQEDIWYAVNVTRVIQSPRQMLETFGSTTIRYHILSELMDQVNKVRVRAGLVYSERPQIITPAHFATQLLDGFGDKAKEYADWLLSQGDIVRILRYGLQFRKDHLSEKFLSGTVDQAAAQVQDKILERDDPFSAVVIGADELWEVSLLKFVVDYIQQSVPGHADQLASPERAQKEQARAEIEQELASPNLNSDQIRRLGRRLQKYGLYEEYEDRFYNLLRKMI